MRTVRSEHLFSGFCPVDRRDSMYSAYRIGPAASGRGLCDIDTVLLRVTKSRIKKLEVLAWRKFTDYN